MPNGSTLLLFAGASTLYLSARELLAREKPQEAALSGAGHSRPSHG